MNVSKRTTTEVVTDDPSWFIGPPYTVAEQVFDEFDIEGCSLDPETFSEMQTVPIHRTEVSDG